MLRKCLVCLSLGLFVCLSVCLSVSRCVCLSLALFVCLSVSLVFNILAANSSHVWHSSRYVLRREAEDARVGWVEWMPNEALVLTHHERLLWTCCLRIFLAISARCQRVQWWPTVGVGPLYVCLCVCVLSGSRMLLPGEVCHRHLSVLVALTGEAKACDSIEGQSNKSRRRSSSSSKNNNNSSTATATATIAAIYVSSFVLPLSRSLLLCRNEATYV